MVMVEVMVVVPIPDFHASERWAAKACVIVYLVDKPV